jgi:SAM-dependent methyltransferase
LPECLAAERWLAAIWPVVRDSLPPAPAKVVELGCGPLGGFVPRMRASGYDAIGVDPEAPAGDAYRQFEFEHAEPFRDLGAIVASTSLHHVTDPADVIDRVAASLAPSGRVVVVEWDWKRFDERTAAWCFARLGDEPGWLQRRRDEAAGRSWSDALREWAEREGIHTADELLRLLDERFRREHLAHGPYFFADLAETSAEDELAAIEAGEIQATRIDYAGTRSA